MTKRSLPPEWAPQSGVMLTWPHRHGDWRPWLERVEPVFADIGYHTTRFERLLVSCYDQEHLAHVEHLLRERGADMSRVILFIVPSNDTWARDHGPITVQDDDGRMTLLDFTFNGWGKKYEAGLDNAITRSLHSQEAFGANPIETVDLVLEGGSIEVDGKGTLLTTAQCLLTPTRNPHLDQKAIEGILSQTLGIERFLWLTQGHLQGDDTDSHIDTLARFCDETTIAYVACDDESDPHYQALKAMEAELQGFRTATGEPYRLVPLPMTRAIVNDDGARLPATYANFLIINDAVLVATYDDPADDRALAQLQSCFPGREIIAIDCSALIMQYGSLHCVTMQLPEGALK